MILSVFLIVFSKSACFSVNSSKDLKVAAFLFSNSSVGAFHTYFGYFVIDLEPSPIGRSICL